MYLLQGAVVSEALGHSKYMFDSHMSPAGPTKMFLLIHGQFPEDSISSGFLYKRGFQLRMKKGLQV